METVEAETTPQCYNSRDKSAMGFEQPNEVSMDVNGQGQRD